MTWIIWGDVPSCTRRGSRTRGPPCSHPPTPKHHHKENGHISVKIGRKCPTFDVFMILQRECRQCPVEDRKRPTHQLPHGVAVEEALLAALLNKCSLDAQVDLGQQAEHGAHVLLLRAQVLDARGLVDLESRGAVRAAHLEERKEEKEGTEKWGQVSEMGGAMGGKGGGGTR